MSFLALYTYFLLFRYNYGKTLSSSIKCNYTPLQYDVALKLLIFWTRLTAYFFLDMANIFSALRYFLPVHACTAIGSEHYFLRKKIWKPEKLSLFLLPVTLRTAFTYCNSYCNSFVPSRQRKRRSSGRGKYKRTPQRQQDIRKPNLQQQRACFIRKGGWWQHFWGEPLGSMQWI